MTNINDISIRVDNSGNRVLSHYPRRFTPEMIKTVAEVVVKELQRKSKPRLYEDDVVLLKKKLLFNATKPNTMTTWRRYDCYNKLATDLSNTSDIKCAFINIPTQVNRALIMEPSDELQDNIKMVQILHDYLLELPDTTGLSLVQEEIECVCTFIASVAIFGKMLFDQYHRRLLTIKFRDVHFSPLYINMPYENSDAFYRYFVPYPAAAYFLRMVLFYQRKAKVLRIKRPYLQDDHVINPVNFDAKNLASKFKEWTGRVFALSKENDVPHHMTIDQFRNAVKSASVANTAEKHIRANSYPPFIISVQSGEIQSYSYSNELFPYYLGIDNVEPEYRYPKAEHQKLSENSPKKLIENALAEIKVKRRDLLTKSDTLPERRATSKEIDSVVQSYKPPRLKDSDYRNMVLFAGWIDAMLMYNDVDKKSKLKKKKAKTVDNYITKVEDLLYELSDFGAIYEISKSERKEAIKRAMLAHGKAEQKVIKQFEYFVEKELGDKFDKLNWRDPDLRKEDAPSLKPLISPMHLENISRFFSDEFLRIRKRRRAKDVKVANHKAEVLSHMSLVSYYSSARIDEVASLRINNITFDGGIVINILKSKTKNGERDIPFERLAPPEYMVDFKNYYEKRKRSSSPDDLLFPQLVAKTNNDGKIEYIEKRWNTSYASCLVGRVLKEQISPDFVFHNFRDSFASLLLFRLFILYFGKSIASNLEGLPFLKNDDLFNNDCMQRLNGLVQGMGKTPKKGQDLFSYALAVIARLVGHGGPRTSFRYYLHTTDWLFYFLSKHSDDQTEEIDSKQARSFHQVTYSGLPKKVRFKGTKIVKVNDLLESQLSLLRVAKVLTIEEQLGIKRRGVKYSRLFK